MRSRSLIMMKPDAYQRDLVDVIKAVIAEHGLQIIRSATVMFQPFDLLILWPRIHTLWGWLASQEYMLGNYLEVLEVEGENAIETALQVKSVLRDRYCNNEDFMRKLIHTPDTIEDYERECRVLFDLVSDHGVPSLASGQRAWMARFLSSPELFPIHHWDMAVSAVVVGSGGSGRCDEWSDWDFHVFIEPRYFEFFGRVHGTHFVYEDKQHNPPGIVLVRPYGYLDALFDENSVHSLWVYQQARILRDDHGWFSQYVEKAKRKFAERLKDEIKLKYLRFRCARHSIDSAANRHEGFTIHLVTAQTVTRGLELVHLLYGQPYPYERYLYSATQELLGSQASDILELAYRLLESDCTDAGNVSRQFTAAIIDLMVEHGHDRTLLERWWEYI